MQSSINNLWTAKWSTTKQWKVLVLCGCLLVFLKCFAHIFLLERILFCCLCRCASLSTRLSVFFPHSVFQRITVKFKAKDYENQCCVWLQRGLLLGICTQHEAVSGYVGLSCLCVCSDVCVCEADSSAGSLQTVCRWGGFDCWEVVEKPINTTHPAKKVLSCAHTEVLFHTFAHKPITST